MLTWALMQGKLLNNCCELVLNAQALLRIPRLDLSLPARVGWKLNSPALLHPCTLNSSALMMEAAALWHRREKGGRSKALSHVMQFLILFFRAQIIILFSGLAPQGWVSTQHRIKSPQAPPKTQHWGGGTGLEIPVWNCRGCPMKTRPDTTPESISVRINCKIKNICAVSGSHPNFITFDEILWEVLLF